MNIKKLNEDMKNLQKFFVDPDGEIHIAADLHERLAREICAKNGWEWKQKGVYSAEDFLLEKRFIKFSNYAGLKYVAASKKYIRDREIMDTLYKLADMFNLTVELY